MGNSPATETYETKVNDLPLKNEWIEICETNNLQKAKQYISENKLGPLGNDITPLHFCGFYSLKILQLLIDSKKIDINSRDNLKNTPLHWYSTKNQLDSLKLLINSNANLNLLNSDGKNIIFINLKYKMQHHLI